MTKWEYLTAPIRTHAAKQILDTSAPRAWELVQIAPGMKPKLAELGSAVHDVVPTVVVYQSAVRDGDRVFTSGQLRADLVVGLLGTTPAMRFVERTSATQIGHADSHQADSLLHGISLARRAMPADARG